MKRKALIDWDILRDYDNAPKRCFVSVGEDLTHSRERCVIITTVMKPKYVKDQIVSRKENSSIPWVLRSCSTNQLKTKFNDFTNVNCGLNNLRKALQSPRNIARPADVKIVDCCEPIFKKRTNRRKTTHLVKSEDSATKPKVDLTPELQKKKTNTSRRRVTGSQLAHTQKPSPYFLRSANKTKLDFNLQNEKLETPKVCDNGEKASHKLRTLKKKDSNSVIKPDVKKTQSTVVAISRSRYATRFSNSIIIGPACSPVKNQRKCSSKSRASEKQDAGQIADIPRKSRKQLADEKKSTVIHKKNDGGIAKPARRGTKRFKTQLRDYVDRTTKDSSDDFLATTPYRKNLDIRKAVPVISSPVNLNGYDSDAQLITGVTPRSGFTWPSPVSVKSTPVLATSFSPNIATPNRITTALFNNKKKQRGNAKIQTKQSTKQKFGNLTSSLDKLISKHQAKLLKNVEREMIIEDRTSEDESEIE